ncbi:hypothetical protein ACFOY2_39335 [Nonomuraea purpurea]|uniref:LPXTG cell wall anchor domain-containing protein n=1 Tax=Nonomuraea purpurea TaxID=1849276 RepID=A0ABV8GJZ5_9ACTN
MSRLRKALIAVSVGMAASAAFIMTPADADSFNLVVNYSCTGGIAGTQPVTLQARVNVPTVLQVGSSLNLGWKLDYTGTRRFISPGYFEAGALTSMVGSIKLTGAWSGSLEALGTKEQVGLASTVPLEIPEALSYSAHLTKAGVIKLRPQNLTMDFLPPKSEITVNDDAAGVKYDDSWMHDPNTRDEYGDHGGDVHTSTTKGAKAGITFTGTGFEYIGRRMPDVSRVRVTVDEDASGEVDPKLKDGKPTNATEGNISLWKRMDLPYGEHTVTIESLDAAPIHLDAFKLHTKAMVEAPTLHTSTCVPSSDTDIVEITVKDGSLSPSPTGDQTTPPPTTPPPTNSGSPTAIPTGTTPTPGPQSTWPTDGLVSVVPRGSSTPTTTRSATPTATKYVRAQVAKIPKGGVETGEAPDDPSNAGALGLILSGSVMIAGSATGGLLLWRRRAAHAGGDKR